MKPGIEKAFEYGCGSIEEVAQKTKGMQVQIQTRTTLQEDFTGVADRLREMVQDGSSEGPLVVLLVGQEASGKSQFVRFLHLLPLIATEKPDDSQIVKLYSEIVNTPRETSKALTTTQLNLGTASALLEVVDIPGWNDRRGTESEFQVEQEHIERIREAIRKVKHLCCIVIVINATITSSQLDIDASITELEQAIDPSVRQRTLIVFSWADCMQKRVYPVCDPGIVDEVNKLEILRQKEQPHVRFIFHLDNPVSRLEGMKDVGVTVEDLSREFKTFVMMGKDPDEDPVESRDREIRREVKKGAKECVKFLRSIIRIAESGTPQIPIPDTPQIPTQRFSLGTYVRDAYSRVASMAAASRCEANERHSGG